MDPGDEIVMPLPITQGTMQQIPNGCTGSSLNSAASIKLSHSLTNRVFVFWRRTSLVAQINNTCHICLHYCISLVKLLLDTSRVGAGLHPVQDATVVCRGNLKDLWC